MSTVREAPAEAPVVPPGSGRPDRWKVLFVLLLVGGLLGGAAWVLLGSRLLVVRQVEVTGLDVVDRARVLAAAGVPIGAPMARLDTSGVRDRIAEIKEIESVRVDRRWPTTVRIAVTERVPVAVVHREGKFFQLDRVGVTVLTTKTRPAHLPALVVAGPGPADPATGAALRVLRALPTRIGARVLTVEALSPEAVTLRLSGGVSIVWGSAERPAEKLKLVDSLLATRAGRAVRTLDVSSPGVVTTR